MPSIAVGVSSIHVRYPAGLRDERAAFCCDRTRAISCDCSSVARRTTTAMQVAALPSAGLSTDGVACGRLCAGFNARNCAAKAFVAASGSVPSSCFRRDAKRSKCIKASALRPRSASAFIISLRASSRKPLIAMAFADNCCAASACFRCSLRSASLTSASVASASRRFRSPSTQATNASSPIEMSVRKGPR